MNDVIEIKLSGEGITPDKIRAKDLAEVITSFEEGMIPLLLRKTPNLNLDELVIGLVEVEAGSVKLRFVSSMVEITLASFLIFTDSIANNNFEQLPVKSIESVQRLTTCAKKYNCNIDFRSHPESSKPLAQITPNTEIAIPENRLVKGQSTIYGRIERVGGKDPSVMITALNGQTIYCKVKMDFAKKLGTKLYSLVGLIGNSRWNLDDYTIESFEITGLLNYEDTPITDAISELSKTIGKYWADTKDVIKAVSEIRGEA